MISRTEHVSSIGGIGQGIGMIRRLSRLSAYAAVAVFLAPVFALIPACFVDFGGDGRIRVSFFPVALTLLDPFVWTSVWNSLIVAVIVTSLSAAGGVVIGRIIAKEGFAANGAILFLATAGLAIPPLYAALGLREVFRSLASGFVASGNANWAALVLSHVSNGVPFVAMITIMALRRVDPVWEESARLAGATPRKIWRKIVWPAARPEVARSLGLIFGLSVLDPCSPSLLGLRRTVGFQVVQAAGEGGLIGRASAFTVLALSLAAFGRLLLGWWGGTPLARSAPALSARPSPRRPSWTGFTRLLPVLAIVFLASGVPLIGLIRGFEAGTNQESAGSVLPWIAIFEETWIRNALVNSLWLGLMAVLVDLMMVKILTTGISESYGRERLTRLARYLETIPPAVFAMGAFVVPELLRILHRFTSLQGILELLDAHSGSWLPLVLCVSALRFSIVARARVEDSWELRPACLDSLRLAGASTHRRPSAGWGGVSIATILLTFSLAANTVAPALLLAPTAETRPIGATILTLSDSPQPYRGAAFALAFVGIGLNLAAFLGIARESKTRPSEPL